MAIEKIKSSPFTSKLGQIRILIFPIAIGAKYIPYVKFIATEAPTFLGYTISVLASVY